jgi:hypothetical protein
MAITLYRKSQRTSHRANGNISLCVSILALLISNSSSAHGVEELWKKVLAAGQTATPRAIDKWEITSGSFVISSEIPEEPSLTCYYAVPTIRSGKPSPRKNDVLYFFHTPSPKDGNILDNGLCNRLVSDLGMTVFGISFRASSQSGLFFGGKDTQQKFYVFAKSGSFQSILTAWSAMRRQFSIPTKQFFIYGYSAGGIGVQRFAEEYPEFCAGVISVNGHTFTQKNHATCPVLIIHSFGDSGSLAGCGLMRYYALTGTPCVRTLLSPSWERMKEGNDFGFHAVNGNVTELATTFLESLVDLRTASGKGTVPPMSEWPYVTTYEDPLAITPITRGRSGGAIQVPDGTTPMGIPSARFYAQLLDSPLTPLRIQSQGEECFLIRPRPTRPARGLVTLVQTQESLANALNNAFPQRSFVDGQYFSENGFAVLVANSTTTAAGSAAAVERLVPNVSQLENTLIVVDPTPGAILTGPPVKQAIAMFTTPCDLTGYLEEYQKVLQRSTRLLVLLPYRNQVDYDAALATVNPAVRRQLFPPFTATGQNLDLSIRQQQIESALAFLNRNARTGN